MSELSSSERQCALLTATAMNFVLKADKAITLDAGQDTGHVQMMLSGSILLPGYGVPCPIVGCTDPIEQVLTILMELPVNPRPSLSLYAAMAEINDRLTAGCVEYNLPESKLYFRTASFFRATPLKRAAIRDMLTLLRGASDCYLTTLLSLLHGEITQAQFHEAVTVGGADEDA